MASDLGITRAAIPWEREGDELVGFGAFRILEAFDGGAAEEIREDVRSKMETALRAFPELAGTTVTVGRLAPDDDVRGRAMFHNFLVSFPVSEYTSHQTVYHELAHLAIHVRNERGEDVPITSEEFCSILGVSRMPPDQLYRDDISYLGKPDVPKDDWPDICQRALEYREEHRNYIQQCRQWLGIGGNGGGAGGA